MFFVIQEVVKKRGKLYQKMIHHSKSYLSWKEAEQQQFEAVFKTQMEILNFNVKNVQTQPFLEKLKIREFEINAEINQRVQYYNWLFQMIVKIGKNKKLYLLIFELI